MVYDPEKRPSAHLLLQHPYFEDVAENKYLKVVDGNNGYVGQADDLMSPPSLSALAAVKETEE